MTSILVRFASISVLVFGLAACAKASIESEKSSSYKGTPQRLLVVAMLGPGFNQPRLQFEDSFTDQLSAAFHACGVVSDIELSESVATLPRSLAKAKDFSPDTTLFIQQVEGTLVRGQSVDGSYLLKLNDKTSNAMVWQAELHISSGSHKTTALVETIINRMVADTILPAGCVLK